MELDLVIRDALVVDGSGSPARDASVGIAGDRIAAVGPLNGVNARRELRAAGLVCAPGFIDAHTHSDLAYLNGDFAIAAAPVLQGVTSEVCGNCGFSPFPCLPSRTTDLERHVDALLGAPAAWSDLETWARRVQEAGLYGNLVALTGHGSLRAGVMGPVRRAPHVQELREMQRLTEVCLEQGAAGFSSGLIYTPGVFAGTDELVALAHVAARYGRPYATHVRGETDGVADAVREAITIGRRSGAPVQISHHKTAGTGNWGRTHETLALIDAARQEGVDVTLDVYPYSASSTMLHAMLPPWVQEGGRDRMLARLAAREVRQRLRTDIATGLPGWENMPAVAGWERVVVASSHSEPRLEGSTIAALAEMAGADPVDYVADLLISTRARAIVVLHVMAEEDVTNVLRFGATMVGSDGIPLPGRPHPRLAGTFVRVLARYWRERRVLGLADAIHRMTGLPAARFGLVDRGIVREGAVADLVVFDPDRIRDRATFVEPLRPPAGVVAVVVGGTEVVADGALNGAMPGRVLRVA